MRRHGICPCSSAFFSTPTPLRGLPRKFETSCVRQVQQIGHGRGLANASYAWQASAGVHAQEPNLYLLGCGVMAYVPVPRLFLVPPPPFEAFRANSKRVVCVKFSKSVMDGDWQMLRMLGKLLQEYTHKSRIFISWDAASWHMSLFLGFF